MMVYIYEIIKLDIVSLRISFDIIRTIYRSIKNIENYNSLLKLIFLFLVKDY